MRRASTILTGFITLAWILFSLYPVARYGGAVVLDPATTSRIMSVRNDDVIHSGIGLVYHGYLGAALVIIEVLLVLAALVVVMLPPVSRSLPAVAGRIGLTILVAWTLLWLGNTLWMEWLAGGEHPGAAIPAVILTAVVVVFAVLRWMESRTHHKDAEDTETG